MYVCVYIHTYIHSYIYRVTWAVGVGHAAAAPQPPSSAVYLSVCLSVYLSICLSVFLSVCLSVCLSGCLSVYLSFCLSVCPSVCLSVCLCIYLSARTSSCMDARHREHTARACARTGTLRVHAHKHRMRPRSVRARACPRIRMRPRSCACIPACAPRAHCGRVIRGRAAARAELIVPTHAPLHARDDAIARAPACRHLVSLALSTVLCCSSAKFPWQRTARRPPPAVFFLK